VYSPTEELRCTVTNIRNGIGSAGDGAAEEVEDQESEASADEIELHDDVRGRQFR
jgi:hypothetical protein